LSALHDEEEEDWVVLAEGLKGMGLEGVRVVRLSERSLWVNKRNREIENREVRERKATSQLDPGRE
jgi:hypothetical protein